MDAAVVAVVADRQTRTAYSKTYMLSWIGLGSNLGDSPTLLRSAVRALSQLPQTELVAVSAFYRSAALRLEDDSEVYPDYCNAVAALRTQLSPEALLKALLKIEREHGRDRASELRWRPRCLDLDLLAMGQLRVKTEDLKLPHPELHKRDFVLQPWRDLAPAQALQMHPCVAESLRQLGSQPLQSWALAIPLS